MRSIMEMLQYDAKHNGNAASKYVGVQVGNEFKPGKYKLASITAGPFVIFDKAFLLI
jgi:hypothetical protein